MAANPNLIGGGRYTRAEVSGDKRRFQGATVSKGSSCAAFGATLAETVC